MLSFFFFFFFSFYFVSSIGWAQLIQRFERKERISNGERRERSDIVYFLPYRDAIMMMKLAGDEIFGVVVNVGWKQFT